MFSVRRETSLSLEITLIQKFVDKLIYTLEPLSGTSFKERSLAKLASLSKSRIGRDSMRWTMQRFGVATFFAMAAGTAAAGQGDLATYRCQIESTGAGQDDELASFVLDPSVSNEAGAESPDGASANCVRLTSEAPVLGCSMGYIGGAIVSGGTDYGVRSFVLALEDVLQLVCTRH
jgi:hypothetical protein